MNLIFFASFIIFILWLAYELRKSSNQTNKTEMDFWEREREANGVRRKNLDNLPYVSFPFDRLPSEESFTACRQEVPESLTVLQSLQDKKIVNLGGISNTQLKLTYGTANITPLSEYDANYELFSKHIYLLAEALYAQGRTDEALFILEETLPTGTDISGHYRLLATIYREKGQTQKIGALKEQAQQLHSLSKNAILRSLDEISGSEKAPT